MEQALKKKLEDLLESRDYRALREAFAELNEVDVARFIQSLPRERTLVAFRTLPKDVELEVFAELDAETQQHIIESAADSQLAEIVEELSVDDMVDMLEEMPAGLVKRVLKNSSLETRRLINQFLRYPEDSAGSIMTAEFTDLRLHMTVEEAIKRIRRVGEDKETVYTCYVVDEARLLKGVVSVKDLLLAHDSQTVADIMETDIISVSTHEDQQRVATLMARYDLITLPVVDAENRLVGIVTVDDAMDVIQEEDTEDFERMAAMAPSEKPYLKTSVFQLARNRLPWLLVLMLSSTVSGLVLGMYEAVYAAIPLLVSFIPMLTGTGGNAGSQVSTLVIRGMALGEIRTRDIWRVLWKEVRISVLVGVLLAVVNFIRIVIMHPGNTMVALVVCIALIGSIFIAKTVGSVLPIVAQSLKLDPAMMAAPLITTVVDALVLMLYFNVASHLLLPIV